MRIVFMGTPDFASASLDALLKSDDSVVGVVTQPDRPKGRGQVLTPSPVKLLAQREQIPLLQPLKMKDPEFLQALAGWKPDLIAVAAFGRILPPAILSLPRVAASMCMAPFFQNIAALVQSSGQSLMAKQKQGLRPC